MTKEQTETDSIALLARWVITTPTTEKMVRQEYIVEKLAGGSWELTRRGVRLGVYETKGQAKLEAEEHLAASRKKAVQRFSGQTRNLHARVSHATYSRLEDSGAPVGGVAGRILDAWAAGSRTRVSEAYDHAADRLTAVRALQRDEDLAAMVRRAIEGRLEWSVLERSLRRDLVVLMSAELELEGLEEEDDQLAGAGKVV